jgi:tRNA (cytidine/uridine-2'-O-)-methyltransferase
MRLALFQPDIPQNVGASIRAAACFGAGLDIIEPCGFPLDSREIRRVAMDYGALAQPVAHSGWSCFVEKSRASASRIVLLTTRAEKPIWDFEFRKDDTLLMGRESAGAPEKVHETVDARVTIPLAPGARSLNVAVAAAVALAEARRQIGWDEA